MSETAWALDDGVTRELGTVLGRNDDGWTVLTDGGRYQARRALSCLVEPAVSDRVLVVTASQGSCWLLAVLERRGSGAVLSVEGDLTIQPSAGRVVVAAQEGVTLASGETVSIVSQRIAVHAREGSVVVDQLRLLGQKLASEVREIRAFARTVDSWVDRFSQRVKRSSRTVTELDRVRSGHIDYQADKNMSLRGDNALLTARRLVKVDGEQVHLG